MKSVSDLISNPTHVAISASTAVAVSLLLSLLLNHSKSTKTLQSRKVPPMPSTTLPILKNLLDIHHSVDRFHDWVYEQAKAFDFRPWMYHIPGRPETIVLTSPDSIEDVLSTEGAIFLRGPMGQYLSYDLFGKGLIIADGEQWHYHRKIASHLFTMQRTKDIMETIVVEKLHVLLDVLATYHARHEPFSLKTEFHHFSMDIITKIGLGVELHTLRDSPTRDSEHEFLEAFDSAAIGFAVRVQTPTSIWRLQRFLNLGKEKTFRNDIATLHNFINQVIRESMEKKAQRAAMNQKLVEKDLISLFLESNLPAPENVKKHDDDLVTTMRDMVTTFVFAGKDAVAHSMCWFIIMMNRYPKILRKIRDEMQQNVPGLLTGAIRVAKAEHVRHLVYLEAAIKENLRLTPSTGFLARECMQDTTLRDGTFIQKGQTIMVSSYCNGRNPITWGHDALAFQPERMIDPHTKKLRVFSPFAFSTFGAGQHVCLGLRFAMMEMKMTLATLLSKFDVTTVDDPWLLTYEFSIMFPVKGPLNVTLTPVAGLTTTSGKENDL